MLFVRLGIRMAKKKYTPFLWALVIGVSIGLPSIGLSQTPAKKARLTPEELEKAKQMEELLLGKGELSAIASTYLQKKWELPSAVYVVTSKDIKESGTRRLTDLFRDVPGVSVSSLSWGSSSVAMRGLRSPFFAGKFGGQNVYTLAFQDGRYMQSPMFGGTFWEQMPLLLGEIDRIEIMRGPGAALYGANAVSGAINIITKDPEKTHGINFTGGFGNQETTFGDAMFGHGIGNFDFRLGTSYERDAGFGRHNGMGIDDTVRYSKTTFRGKYRFTPELSAELLAGVTYGDIQPLMSDINTRFNARRRDHQWPYIHTKLKYDISDTQEILLSYYWQMHSWQERDRFSPLDVKETLQEFELRHSFQLGERNRVVWGANLRPVRVKSPVLGGAVLSPTFSPFSADRRWAVVNDIRDHDTVTGFFVQDEIKILENLKATLGVKFEHNTFTDSDYASKASLVYAPWKEHAFRWSVARAFRTPTFTEDAINLPIDRFYRKTQFGTRPLVKFDTIGNKRLDNELLHSLELGYTGRFLDKLDVGIEAFYYDYSNLIVPAFEEVPPTPPFLFNLQRTFMGTDNAEGRGIEVDLRYPLTKWWEVRANYSRVDFSDRNHAEAGPRNVLGRLYPSNLANLSMLFDLPQDFSARLWLNYSGNIETKLQPDAATVHTIEDYVRVDARLAKSFAKGRGEVSVVGQNLLGRHEEGGLFSIPGTFADKLVEVDRKVFFSIDLHF